jgi:hypothetical protein
MIVRSWVRFPLGAPINLTKSSLLQTLAKDDQVLGAIKEENSKNEINMCFEE